jgi:hypothetical protein
MIRSDSRSASPRAILFLFFIIIFIIIFIPTSLCLFITRGGLNEDGWG